MHSDAFTRSLLPDISLFLVGLFSTPVGLSWYHASIAPPRESLFSTPMGLLALTRLPCLKILISTDPLLASLFNTPVDLLRIRFFFNMWKPVGT